MDLAAAICSAFFLVGFDEVFFSMDLEYFTIGYLDDGVNLNGKLVSYEQAVMIAIHIIEGVGSERTVVDLSLVNKGDECSRSCSDMAVDSTASIS